MVLFQGSWALVVVDESETKKEAKFQIISLVILRRTLTIITRWIYFRVNPSFLRKKVLIMQDGTMTKCLVMLDLIR